MEERSKDELEAEQQQAAELVRNLPTCHPLLIVTVVIIVAIIAGLQREWIHRV